MEHEAIGWVKKEVMQLEPSSALLEEPSGITTSSDDVKMDPELKVEVTASEWNVYPLAVDALSNCDLRSIKKEGSVNCQWMDRAAVLPTPYPELNSSRSAKYP
ncbi:uncharacterized protein LOC124553804 isoform X5 [Schistocerca americana]|uniref:uncharacterized protein LOC124553804 isoform X5 n=1 Tax=Schistocerca americana TaxID=7009 RepID=UPI001F502DFC|nr:uncharacterized protein LOC124553804 isoform X5 [Schistocerca americana]